MIPDRSRVVAEDCGQMGFKTRRDDDIVEYEYSIGDDAPTVQEICRHFAAKTWMESYVNEYKLQVSYRYHTSTGIFNLRWPNYDGLDDVEMKRVRDYDAFARREQERMDYLSAQNYFSDTQWPSCTAASSSDMMAPPTIWRMAGPTDGYRFEACPSGGFWGRATFRPKRR